MRTEAGIAVRIDDGNAARCACREHADDDRKDDGEQRAAGARYGTHVLPRSLAWPLPSGTLPLADNPTPGLPGQEREPMSVRERPEEWARVRWDGVYAGRLK